MNVPQLSTGDIAPLLSDLTKDTATQRGILGDICGANYAIKGSAWGYGISKGKNAWSDPSHCGVFATTNGDTVTIAFNHSKYYNVLVEQLKVRYDAVFMYADYNGTFWTGPDIVAQQKAQSIGALQLQWDVTTNGTGWSEKAADELKKKVPEILQLVDRARQIKGKSVNLLVVLHRDEPFNFTDFAVQFIQMAAAIAQFVPGVPKEIVAKATQTLKQWKDTGVVDVQAVMACALALAPDSLRKSEYVTKGTAVYNALSKKDYLGAAKQVGIDVPGMLSEFQKTCDWTQISKTATIGFDSAISTLQNMLSADAVNKLAGGLRSGKLVMDTIAGQSITTVKQFQDVILGGINPQAIMTLIPQPYEIAKTILNETNDITSSNEFRAIVGLGSGIAVGDNVLDGLSIKAIAARVEDTLASRYAQGVKDLQYSLSTSIDVVKREYFATEVSKLTGAQILTNTSDASITSNLKKAAPYIAVGAAAVGTLYYYNKRKQ